MKQIAWIYIVLAGLAMAFGIVCIAILFLGPRPALVSKKLRFGAMIIAFNTMLAGCYAARDAKESVTCYTDSDCDTDSNANSDSQNNSDSETEKDTTTTGSRDTDVTCYEMVMDSGIRDTDTADVGRLDTDTEEQPNDSDTGYCYDPYNETDVECYDIVEEYPTDSDTPSNDGGVADADTYDTESVCYIIL